MDGTKCRIAPQCKSDNKNQGKLLENIILFINKNKNKTIKTELTQLHEEKYRHNQSVRQAEAKRQNKA